MDTGVGQFAEGCGYKPVGRRKRLPHLARLTRYLDTRNKILSAEAEPLARIVGQPVECSPCLLRECRIDHR